MHPRHVCMLILSVSLLACGKKDVDDGRSKEQREHAAKTDEAAKKGALRKEDEPAKDLKKQQQNLARLRKNVEGNRAQGNRVAAWTAERDARQVEKLIEKDREALGTSGSKAADDADEDDKKGDERPRKEPK